MSLEIQGFEFGDFFLDRNEKVLLRVGSPVAITPKAFLLLLTLVENHGHIIEKNRLIERVWPDSFVEEGNLSFTINQLRKILGDSKSSPRFIETVSRRGYRFVAEVRSRTEPNGAAEPLAKASNQGFSASSSDLRDTPKDSDHPIRSPRLVPALVGCLAVSLVIVGLWFALGRTAESNVPALTAPFRSEKLSTDGKVYHALVSPDGKNVVYTSGMQGEKQSIWLRHLETGDNVEIVPASDSIYGGIALSPDGNLLYFVRQPPDRNENNAIYRTPIIGGVAQKIVDGPVEGWIGISPDGAKVSFVRCPRRDDEWCSLWMADAADGKNEKRLASRPRPIRISDNEFSPDGRSIAFAVGQSGNAANDFLLAGVNIDDGTERELTSERFFNVRALSWLPDMSGLLITASRIPNRHFLIWHVSAETGSVRALTKDSETYFTLSLDKKGVVVASTLVEPEFHVDLFDFDAPSRHRVLSDRTTVAFVDETKVLFSSSLSGNEEIWSINSDGTNRRQLTNNAADDQNPVFAPGSNFIFFSSNRTGEARVWRMNPDGSNQKEITDRDGGFVMFASPDGQWAYYVHGTKRTLWRVPARGGSEELVSDRPKAFSAAISSDGQHLAFAERKGEEWYITIAALVGGQTLKTLRLADNTHVPWYIAWLPDGKSLTYVTSDSGYNRYTLWLQGLDDRSPRKLIDLDGKEVSGLAVSPEGQTLAVAQGRWKHNAIVLRGLR